MAASMAEPPARKTSTPALDASECGDVTMPRDASVAGRPVLISNGIAVSSRDALAPGAADHVIVVGGLADLAPLMLLVAERRHGIVKLFEKLSAIHGQSPLCR